MQPPRARGQLPCVQSGGRGSAWSEDRLTESTRSYLPSSQRPYQAGFTVLSTAPPPPPGILSRGLVGSGDWIILWGGRCPGDRRRSSGLPGLYPPHASTVPLPYVTTRDVS